MPLLDVVGFRSTTLQPCRVARAAPVAVVVLPAWEAWAAPAVNYWAGQASTAPLEPVPRAGPAAPWAAAGAPGPAARFPRLAPDPRSRAMTVPQASTVSAEPTAKRASFRAGGPKFIP